MAPFARGTSHARSQSSRLLSMLAHKEWKCKKMKEDETMEVKENGVKIK